MNRVNKASLVNWQAMGILAIIIGIYEFYIPQEVIVRRVEGATVPSLTSEVGACVPGPFSTTFPSNHLKNQLK